MQAQVASGKIVGHHKVKTEAVQRDAVTFSAGLFAWA